MIQFTSLRPLLVVGYLLSLCAVLVCSNADSRTHRCDVPKLVRQCGLLTSGTDSEVEDCEARILEHCK